jgi:hypothetical protein
MSLRRGFKASANRRSIRLRRGLGLRPEDPIDLRAIAAKLDVPIVPLSTFSIELPEAVKQLSIVDTAAFSAATVPIENGRRVIIFNDAHDPGRQNSNIAHEIAHILLGHQSTLPIDSSGKRVVDREIEEEANWLGATILISNEAALRIVRDGLSTRDACNRYGVSASLLQMRRNASGAVIRARRASAH